MFKEMYAIELAENLWGLQTARNYEGMEDVLYADLEVAGYTWTGDSWLSDEYIAHQQAEARAKRWANVSTSDLDLLQAWNSGKPIQA